MQYGKMIKKLRKGTSGLLIGSIMLAAATFIIILMVGFVQVYYGTTDIDNLTEIASRQIILCESRAEAYEKINDTIDKAYLANNVSIADVRITNTDGSGWNNEDMISVEITGHIRSSVGWLERDYTSKKLVIIEKEDTFTYTATSQIETWTRTALRQRYNISPAGVAAILANIYRECGGSFDVDPVVSRHMLVPGTPAIASGIFRYVNLYELTHTAGYDRRNGFMRFIYFGLLNLDNRDFEDYETQITFMMEELDGSFNPSERYEDINGGYSLAGVREKILSASDRHEAKDAAIYFMKMYEPYPYTEVEYEVAKEQMDAYIDYFFDNGHMDESY